MKKSVLSRLRVRTMKEKTIEHDDMPDLSSLLGVGYVCLSSYVGAVFVCYVFFSYHEMLSCDNCFQGFCEQTSIILILINLPFY